MRSTLIPNSSDENGLEMKSQAPSFIASTARSTVPCAVIHQHIGVRRAGLDFLQDSDAVVRPGHLQIGDDQVGPRLLQDAQALVPAAS